MDISKNYFLFTLLLAALVLGSSVLLWETPFVLILVLTLVSIVMVSLQKDKVDLYLFIFTFLLGPLAEAAMILVGAWTYASPNILGFPLWLPFLWGNAAVFIKRLYFFLKSTQNRF